MAPCSDLLIIPDKDLMGGRERGGVRAGHPSCLVPAAEGVGSPCLVGGRGWGGLDEMNLFSPSPYPCEQTNMSKTLPSLVLRTWLIINLFYVFVARFEQNSYLSDVASRNIENERMYYGIL